MSLDQSFAVAMHAMSVIAFTHPDQVSAVFISKQINVHPVVIRRILVKLVNSNLVNSTPGSRGGYSLAKSAKQINLWDIYSSIHVSGGFANRNAMPTSNCDEGRAVEAVLMEVFANADKALADKFRKSTLADILAAAARLAPTT